VIPTICKDRPAIWNRTFGDAKTALDLYRNVEPGGARRGQESLSAEWAWN